MPGPVAYATTILVLFARPTLRRSVADAATFGASFADLRSEIAFPVRRHSVSQSSGPRFVAEPTTVRILVFIPGYIRTLLAGKRTGSLSRQRPILAATPYPPAEPLYARPLTTHTTK